MDDKEKIAQLEAQVATLQGEIKTKDALIARKTADVVGARKKYKKLDEMTEEEKANLTPEQIAEKEAMDEVVTNQERLTQETAEKQAKEVGERRLNIVKRLVGNDQAVIDKVLANLDQIKNADLATLESEIEPFVNTAINMLGSDRPSPVNQALNGGGGTAPDYTPKEGEFADSQRGKDISSMMGLPTEAPQAPQN